MASALVAIGLIILAGAFAVSGFSPLRLSRTVAGYEERTKDFVAEFSEVRIQDVDASIRVLPSEDGRCSVHYDVTGRSNYHIEIVGDALVIEHERHWLDSFGIFMSAPKLTVYLPRTAYDALDVQDVSGSITVEDLDVGTLNIKTTSGSIRLTDVRAEGDATLKTVSGSIRLASVRADDLTAGTTSGGIRLDDVDAGSLELHTVSGSIKGTLAAGKEFDASSVSGRISVPESTPGAGACRASTTSGSIAISISE